MKKKQSKLLLLLLLFTSGCAIGTSFHPFTSAENKNLFQNSNKTYKIKQINIITEDSKKPVQSGYKNKEQIATLLKEDLQKKLVENNLTSPSPTYDLVIKVSLRRVLHLLNSNTITACHYDFDLVIEKNNVTIAKKYFSGQAGGSLLSVFGFSNKKHEDKYYYMASNTIINMINNLNRN